MQDTCLRRLAVHLEACAPEELDMARATIQQVLDDLLGPLRRIDSVDSREILEVFSECVQLVLDIVDSCGIFQSCYAIVTPALGAAALQGLLEVLVQHRSKRSEMLQRLSQEFCRRVPNNIFAAVRRAARHQHLMDAVALDVVRGMPRAQAQQLVAHMEARASQAGLGNPRCDQMTCGAHAHNNLQHREGCGHEFSWNSAPRYQPTTAEQRQPPGFSAILSWVMQEQLSNTQNFLSPAAAAAAEAALANLSVEDRRYAVANACACAFAKRNQRQGGLGQALTAPNTQSLREALGLEDLRLARVVAVLCDVAQQLPESQCLVSALFQQRDNGEEVAEALGGTQGAARLKNAMLNLLVAVLGAPENNHLMMLLLEPTAMLDSYPVGFVYERMPGPEGYHFDCGCVLDAQGRARQGAGFQNAWTTNSIHL
eukprot:Skav236304  [mRNA]  locus=scaffold679:80321:92328:+ [translate_table: standard]